MKDLMKKIQAQALDSQPCYLVALIESEGSTPRTSGAYMLVGEKGLLYGTIGGGGMEYAAQQLAQQRLRCGGGSFVKTFDLSAGTESVRLDLRDLPSGVYTLMIGNTTKKLIVE